MASTDVPVQQRQMAVSENNLRPHLIQFNRCRNVLLDGFKIRQSPFWTIHFYLCDGGIARNLDVYAHGHNNDGIDLEMSRNILIEKCKFDQGDDGVVIKSGRNQDAWRLNTPTENVVIRDCHIVNAHTLWGLEVRCQEGFVIFICIIVRLKIQYFVCSLPKQTIVEVDLLKIFG